MGRRRYVRSIDEIFDMVGGPTEVGRAVGVSRQAANNFRVRRSIPSHYWGRLVRYAQRNKLSGINVIALTNIHEREHHDERSALG